MCLYSVKADHNKKSGRGYSHDSSAQKYNFLKRSCSHVDCTEGGCKYQNCGDSKKNDGEEKNINCTGGLCEFIDTVNPSCRGGSCTFIRCKNATCDGGNCHHVHPRDTLKEEYCNGGGCRLNNEKVTNGFKYYLST